MMFRIASDHRIGSAVRYSGGDPALVMCSAEWIVL